MHSAGGHCCDLHVLSSHYCLTKAILYGHELGMVPASAVQANIAKVSPAAFTPTVDSTARDRNIEIVIFSCASQGLA